MISIRYYLVSELETDYLRNVFKNEFLSTVIKNEVVPRIGEHVKLPSQGKGLGKFYKVKEVFYELNDFDYFLVKIIISEVTHLNQV